MLKKNEKLKMKRNASKRDERHGRSTISFGVCDVNLAILKVAKKKKKKKKEKGKKTFF